jgi:putative ABC transport system permease protein
LEFIATMKPSSHPLRIVLALIDAGRWLAPAQRRRAWHRQWRGDLWHEWQWLEKRNPRFRNRVAFLFRALGALYHALWLRLHVRRIEMLTQDVRYGWRQMVRRPALTVIAVLTLGLGIGANVTMFSWVQVALQRQLRGIPNADRYVAINATTPSRNDISLSYPDFVDLREGRPASVEDVIAFTLAPMNLRVDGEAERTFGGLVSGNYFDALGVTFPIGRGFRPEENRTPNSHPVVVFSHRFWQRRFGADPAWLGRTVTLNGRAFTLVGVAAEDFRGTEPYLNLDLWVPMMMQQAVLGGTDRLALRGDHWLKGLVRLKPDVSIARAQADLDVVANGIAQTYPEAARQGVKLWELWRAPQGGGGAVAGVMAVQLGMAALVLLIACANVANLLLANAATRHRETAVRLSLGASRGRLVRQLLTESTLLAAAGGVAGTVTAYWTKDLVRLFVPPSPLPINLDPQLNGLEIAFAIVVTTATAVIFGLVPALQGSLSSIAAILKDTATAVTAAPNRARARKALVVAQVSLSLLLLVSASLFVRTLKNAQAVDPGFSTKNGILASIDLLPAGYDAATGRALLDRLLAEVRALPGVENASFAQRMPLGFGGSSDMGITVDGYTRAPNEETNAYYIRIGRDYLRTMGISLVTGRDITELDTAERPDVVVINETFAKRYFAGRDPLGGRVRVGERQLEVVGVARDGKYSSITEQPRVFMYLPLAQWYRPDNVLIVKTQADPRAMVPALQSTVRAIDANIPLFDVRTLREHLEIATFVQRMVASLLGVFGLLALALATIGLYGVIAGLVAQRTAEIGMRVALGATTRDVMTLIVRQGLGMTALGIAIGLGLALLTTQAFKTLLVGISATDALSFLGTSVVLMVVALAAILIPARRAASIDPLKALRGM